MYLDHPCRYMYLACIPHVSCISDTYLSGYIRIHLGYMYPIMYLVDVSLMYSDTLADTCIPHVSRACIPNESRMYPSCIARSYAFAFLLADVPSLKFLQARAKEIKRARTAAVHLEQLIDLKRIWLSDTLSPCQHH